MEDDGGGTESIRHIIYVHAGAHTTTTHWKEVVVVLKNSALRPGQ